MPFLCSLREPGLGLGDEGGKVKGGQTFPVDLQGRKAMRFWCVFALLLLDLKNVDGGDIVMAVPISISNAYTLRQEGLNSICGWGGRIALLKNQRNLETCKQACKDAGSGCITIGWIPTLDNGWCELLPTLEKSSAVDMCMEKSSTYGYYGYVYDRTADATTAPTYSPKATATPTNSPTSKIARCAQSERKAKADSGCTDIGENDGDCDKDSDCHGELVCGTDNCEQGGDMIFDITDDCCKSPHNEVGNEAIVLLEVGEIVGIAVCVVLIVILLVTYVFKRNRHASKSTPGAVNANAKPVSESDVAIVDVTSSSPLKVTLEPQFKLVSTHGFCRVVHSLLIITALALLFATFSTPSSHDCLPFSSCLARHSLAGTLFGILYLAYLYECWKCHTRNYLSNISHDAKELAVDIFETCSFKPTTILYRVTCSHQQKQSQEDTVTVVSYSRDHACTWAECDDHSDFSGLEGWDLAGIQAAIQGWADSSERPLIEIDSDWCVRSTDGSLEKARQDLLASNRHRDVNITVARWQCSPSPFQQRLRRREALVSVLCRAQSQPMRSGSFRL
jgi:hypothetical protein